MGYKFIQFLLIIVVLISGSSADDTTPEEQKPDPKKKKEIVVVGDSITFGYCANNRNASSYPGFLAALCGCNVTNHGVM